LPYARVAQSVEQGIENPRVGGSIPPPGTTYLLNPSHSFSCAEHIKIPLRNRTAFNPLDFINSLKIYLLVSPSDLNLTRTTLAR
jgi:hypothetical protein